MPLGTGYLLPWMIASFTCVIAAPLLRAGRASDESNRPSSNILTAAGAGENDEAGLDPQVLARYQTLFGADEERVKATFSTKDDAQFATTLLDRAKLLKDDPALLAVVYSRAYELGIKNADGFEVADEALNNLKPKEGPPSSSWKAKRAELLQQEVKRGNAQQRIDAANVLIEEKSAQAKIYARSKQFTEAFKCCREASAIAASAHSPRSYEVDELYKELQSRRTRAERLSTLEQKLTTRPKDAALLQQVIQGYVFDLEDPAGAARVAALIHDETLQQVLEAAADDPAHVSADQSLMVARWYRDQGSKLSAQQKTVAVDRAWTYYLSFLSQYDKQDSTRLKAAEEAEETKKLLVRLFTSSSIPSGLDRIIVWNTHNSFHNNAGAITITVKAYDGAQVVWKMEGLPVPWAPNRDSGVILPFPEVPTTKVRVEIVRWQGDFGGLSEIQVIRHDRNVATEASVAASAFWRKDPHFAPSNLTDGITTSAQDQKGYWILPNGEAGWAELTFPKVDTAKKQ